MQEKVYQTPSGPIHYWMDFIDEDAPTIVFLPGLMADHRLFDKQNPDATTSEITDFRIWYEDCLDGESD